MQELSSKRRSELRAEAHKLSPVVLIGDKGLTDAVIKEADRALAAHELIKVRASTDDREARSAWMAELCERLQAQAVQVIGKILVIYRENPEKAEPKPKPAPRPARKPARETAREAEKKSAKVKRGAGSLWTKKPKSRVASKSRAATGTSRPRSPAPSPRPASEPRRRRPRTSR